MGRSKLSATARSLTLLASVGAPCLAHAADLLPPPPPPPVPLPVEIGGGWYLRGDIGVGAVELGKVALQPAYIAPPGYAVTEETAGSQFFAGGGVGYQFNSFFRADITGEYRGGGKLSFVETYPSQYVETGFTPIYDKFHDANHITGYAPYTIYRPGTGIDYSNAHLSSIVVMANGYFGLGTWFCLTPYIGGGAGTAFHKVTGFNDIGAGTAAGGFGTAKTKETTSFAWNLQAGVTYDVTSNFKVDVGYRYMNLGDASTGKVTCYNNGCADTGNYYYKFKDITAHDVKIGLRYLLGGAVAAPLPPLAPAYEPGPIVRKY